MFPTNTSTATSYSSPTEIYKLKQSYLFTDYVKNELEIQRKFCRFSVPEYDLSNNEEIAELATKACEELSNLHPKYRIYVKINKAQTYGVKSDKFSAVIFIANINTEKNQIYVDVKVSDGKKT